jgi:hypothetical protein
MVNELIQKKSVQSILIVLVLGIWVYNSWRIFSIPGDHEIIRQSQIPDHGEGESLTIPDVSGFDFKGNFRDPFLPVLEKMAASQQENNREEEVIVEEQLPEFILTGIFENTAVLQDGNGLVHLAEPGDSIGKVIIKSIDFNFITMSFRNRTFTIQLYAEKNEEQQ